MGGFGLGLGGFGLGLVYGVDAGVERAAAAQPLAAAVGHRRPATWLGLGLGSGSGPGSGLGLGLGLGLGFGLAIAG